METRRPSSPSTLLLTLVLLLLAPLLLAREIGGSYEKPLRSPLMLPSDGDGAATPELDAPHAGLGRPGGLVPPAPKPSYGPHPLHEHEPSAWRGLASSPGMSGSHGHELTPPPPEGNPPPHYRRSGPAADVLDALVAFRDALVRYVLGA